MGDGDMEFQKVGDYYFPAGVDVRETLLYTIPFGSDQVEDLKWEGYVDFAHKMGVEKIESEVVESGVWDGSIKYAAVKVSVVTGDGIEVSSLQAADETTNQVRDPEFVWAVAESRALKRAIKKAYNIIPATKEASEEPDAIETPDDVEFEDGHALADSHDDRVGTNTDVDSDGADW